MQGEPTAQNCSSQWSVVRDSALAASGLITDRTWLSRCPRNGKVHPSFGILPIAALCPAPTALWYNVPSHALWHWD